MKLEKLPRQELGYFPTPIIELKRLSQYLNGPRIWMKRDDQTGLAFGGNKTRKLEFFLGDALAKSADTIISAGAAQSNHCRQTAAAAAISNMECHLALGGSPPPLPNGNLLLDQLLGAIIHWCGEKRKGEDIPRIFQELEASGKVPYIVPYGGSTKIGACGFVDAVGELHSQLADMGEEITHLVFASSSGGTHAGLIVGKKIFDGKYHVIGISVDKGATGEQTLDEFIVGLAKETAQYLEVEAQFSPKDVILIPDYLGEGYGVVGDLEREAIALVAKLEGILLDPVYTGRAMGGLIDLIRKKELGKGDKVLFWHTGGTPALFAYAEELVV